MEELAVKKTDVDKMSQEEMNAFVKEKAKFILEKINNSTASIQRAKDATDYARDNSNFHWFNRTRKKAEYTANALVDTTAAVDELSNLVQESVRFTCVSIGFAKTMSKYIMQLLSSGFEDSNGNFIKLSDDATKQAQFIVEQADDFAQKQLAVEEKQATQDKKIQSANVAIDNNKKRITSLSEHLDKKDVLDAQQSESIQKNTKRLEEKDRIDAEQTKRLDELSMLLGNKDAIDERQEEAIKKNKDAIQTLFDFMKQKDELDKEQSRQIAEKDKIDKAQSKRLEEIEAQLEEIKQGAKQHRGSVLNVISIVCSAIALAASGGLIVLSLLHVL